MRASVNSHITRLPWQISALMTAPSSQLRDARGLTRIAASSRVEVAAAPERSGARASLDEAQSLRMAYARSTVKIP